MRGMRVQFHLVASKKHRVFLHGVGVKVDRFSLHNLQVDNAVNVLHILCMTVLEKGVPMPGHRGEKSDERKAMEAMEVGDSFELTPGNKPRVTMIAATLRELERKRFAVRGLRVWRVQ